MPPTEFEKSLNVHSIASQSSFVRRKLEVCVTDAARPRRPARTDRQEDCPNDGPSRIIHVAPLFLAGKSLKTK